MTISNIRIINKTGHARDTEIVAEGVPVVGVTEIVIKPIKPGQIIEATITVMVSELEILAEKFGFISEPNEEKIINCKSLPFEYAMKDLYDDIVSNYGDALISEIYRRSQYNEGMTKVLLENLKEKLKKEGRMRPETLKEYLNLLF